jgi:hypothetical protein
MKVVPIIPRSVMIPGSEVINPDIKLIDIDVAGSVASAAS